MSPISPPRWAITRPCTMPRAFHVAYGGDHLYYARCEGNACDIQVADPADYVGMQASLALDSHGYPHIAYYDVGLSEFCNDEKVKYARWDGPPGRSRW